MVISSPFLVILSAADRAVLTARANSARAPHRMVLRAKIILAAADGQPNTAIEAELGLHVDTARKWRKRFWKHQLDGLKDLPRPGRPASFTPVQVAEVKALACTQPCDSDVPLARWSHAELAAEAVNQHLVTSISPATVGRWLAEDAIKPWQHRSWIYPATRTSLPKPARSWTCTTGTGKASNSARTTT